MEFNFKVIISASLVVKKQKIIFFLIAKSNVDTNKWKNQ